MPTIVAPARASSCLPADVHDQLRDAEFAFIGRPTAEVPAAKPGPRQFLFDVEVWVKGNLGSPVMVRGFEVRQQRRPRPRVRFTVRQLDAVEVLPEFPGWGRQARL